MARQNTRTPNDSTGDFDNSSTGTIFIARERQIDDFKTFLARWQNRMAEMTPDELPEPAVPTPRQKIQGLVVMLFGRGGFGKSTLLRRYRNIALETNGQRGRIEVSGVVDWEFAVEGKRGLFNPPKGQAVDPLEYYKAVASELSPKLGKKFSDCKHLQRALQDVGNARKEAHRALESMQNDDRYGWLRGLAIEGVTTLIRAHVPASIPLLADPTVKNATDEVAKLTQEQITHVIGRLRDRLKTDILNDYLDPAKRLGLAFGEDLRDWAKNYPLLIFFDTYEEIDEGDPLLRIIMGAAGPRVGWVIAGRDNLWGGPDQIERSVAMEYGYKYLVPPDRGLAVNFNASDVGAFSPADISVYFGLLQEKYPEAASLPPLSDKDAKRIWDVTQGVPLAVNLAAAIYRETGKLETVTEKVEGKKTIIDQMVRRYLLHTRSNLNERHKLYGLAMLRRADQPSAIAAALGLTEEEAETGYRSELSYLHRRYSFIFTEKDIPALHQEVRHFLRLWLLEHRTEPEIVAINKRLLRAQEAAFRELEEQRAYATLKERLQDDEWVEKYLNLTEQRFWSDPVPGLNYLLPFIIAASAYNSDVNKDAAQIGEFFEAHLSNPHHAWWQWAYFDLINYTLTIVVNVKNNKLFEIHGNGLEQLERLSHDRSFTFPSPLPKFHRELQAILWWRLIPVSRVKKDNKKALDWSEKALSILGQEVGLRDGVALTYVEIAYELHEKKKYNEAATLFTKFLKLKPDHILVYNARGRTYSDAGNYELALKDFTTAIELDPNHALAYNNRGNTYSDAGNYELALKDFTRAIELDPKNALAYNNRGNMYFENGNYELALKDFTRAIELDPKNALAYNNRASAYRDNNQFEQAIEDYNTAIQLDSNHARYYDNRGLAYSGLKKDWQAIEDYTRAIKLDPKDVRPYNNRGTAYLRCQKDKLAIMDFTRAIELNPEYFLAYMNRGNMYCKQQQYELAIADFSQAINLDSKNATVYYTRGQVYDILKQYELAIADYTQVITINPQFALAYYKRGGAYWNIEKYEQMIADFDHAMALDPDREQFLADLSQTIELDTNNAILYHIRGNTYGGLKRYEEAMADFTRAIILDPDNIANYYNRAFTCLWLQNLIQAMTDFDSAFKLNPKDINAAWMSLWCGMSKQSAEAEFATQLESIAEIDPENYVAYVCRGLAMGLRGEVSKGLGEIQKAIPMKPEEWDAYFWKGMLCAYYYRGRHERAIEAIEKALEVGLPPALLTPLYWLAKDRPEFFEAYARPLLERYEG